MLSWLVKHHIMSRNRGGGRGALGAPIFLEAHSEAHKHTH